MPLCSHVTVKQADVMEKKTKYIAECDILQIQKNVNQ